MSIQERILLALSREPGCSDAWQEESAASLDDALLLLEEHFPEFGTLVSGKRVVDFGCGLGYQSIALARKYGCTVVGIDTNLRALSAAAGNAARFDIPASRLRFVNSISADMIGSFDLVLSQNSFEHFPDPVEILDEMLGLVNDGGRILVTFGPPWFAPHGSHMHFFCSLPWINILFSEETVMKVRSRYRNDGATRYVDVESGLNKMTVARFEEMIRRKDLTVGFRKYNSIKNIDILSRIPLLRELFINHVSVSLSKGHGHGRRSDGS